MKADRARRAPTATGIWAGRLLNGCAGSVAAIALFGMMWLTLADIMQRKFGERSIPGATEVTEIFLVAVIFASLPIVSWRGEHVMLDTLDNWLGERGHAIRRTMVNLASACAYGVLAYLMVVRGLRLAGDGDTTSYLQWPIAPVAMAMAFSLGLTALVHLLLIAVDAPLADDVATEGL
jgi:TRAP-type C4-dicarboxylate transport system permease small subunit